MTTRPQKITHMTTRDPPPQDEKVRTLLYCFKPPFPSDGGFAAASAGRSGLRPEV
ncbi:MAG: hypothetical protein ACLPYY_05520 [Acidimicrobiales bacterium]